MEEVEYHHHHHHHHHHGHGTSGENQGQQNATSSQSATHSVVTEQQQQQNLTVPIGIINKYTNQTLGGIQPTNSFNSVSSGESVAEMSKYFPNGQPSNVTAYRHQQEVEGQAQSTAASTTAVTSNINTVNAGPYIPVSAPFAVQQFPQPVRAPFMAQQQQQQRPIRPPGPPQLPPGIPSYSSQIEGLSVSQALVNDVLIDLQTKVLNETLEQYQNESSSGAYLEPLPPIFIRAPQPTVILRSDLHRLRAELNSRVRPPVVYRHPGGANQFQQHRFQQNTFQTPRFPAPRQQFIPPGCGGYPNAAYAASDEYKTTTTTAGDEYRKEREQVLYNQAESPMLNDDNINDNVHRNAFDLQGLSTTSFDRHASPYESSSFLPNIQDQQQGNEETVLTSSHNINQEEVGTTDNMYSRPVRPRQEITFDINNCIYRCFEAHRQRVARRRAARQARRSKRHKQTGQQQQQQQQQQQYQQSYQTDQYQNIGTQPTYSSFSTSEQTQWEQQQQPPTSSHYSDIATGFTDTSAAVHGSQGPYIPAQTYDYANVAQTTNLPTDVQTSSADYYQFQNISSQEPYIHSNTFDYASHQTVPSSTDFIQQPPIGQQVPTSVDYSNQASYSTYSSADATVPNQFIQNQGTYVQPSSTFEYNAGSTQAQIPTYDYQNIEQQSYQYPYNVDNIQQQSSFNYATAASTTYAPTETNLQQTEQNQTLDYTSQGFDSTNYYQQQQQQQQTVPTSQAQGTYSQPTGTFEYSRESYQSQEPVYDYQGIDQQSSQYSYNTENIQQQLQQQDSYNYASTAADTYGQSQVDSTLIGQGQQFDYSSQGLDSSDYYQQQTTSIPTSQIQEAYNQSSGTFDYTTGGAQTQVPTYDYQNIEQQAYQYPYNIEDIKQQSYNYTNEAGSTFVPSDTNIQQTEQNQTFDYTSQDFDSSNYYQQQPVHVPVSQVQEGYTQQSETFDYSTASTETQIPTYNYQNIEQQSYQYPYNVDNIQEQSFNYASGATSAYVPPEINIQQTEQKQTVDYTSQGFDSSNYYQQQQQQQQQQPAPTSQVQGTYSQPTGTFEYSRESYQTQEPVYDYQGIDQQSSQYSYNTENIQQQLQQQDTFNYASDTGATYSTSEKNIQQPVNVPISHTYDSQVSDQRLPGGSVPTGTVEYTRQAYFSQEPLSDNYTTETFIEQHKQQQQNDSWDVNDYARRFESESYAQQTGGQIKSSDDLNSVNTVTTTPFIIQQNIDVQPSQGAKQTYDLRNYTNESIVSETSQLPLSSSIYEEDRQHLLQQQQAEQHSEIEVSANETYSSLPPPPTGASEEIDYQQESIATNTSEFPPPPTPDRHTYQITEQRPSRSYNSIIPSVDQPSIYTEQQQLQRKSPSSSDHGTDDDIKEEEEEVFDLQQCIANCYAKYQNLWNKDEQQKYQQQIQGTQQTGSVTNIINNQQIDQYQQVIPQQPISITNKCPEQPRQYYSTGEIHYIDGWTQTPSLDVIKQDNIVQHKYDETPSTFDTKPYIPHLSARDLSTDSRGQQTIEYSPPLITQTRHIIPPSAPLQTYEYSQYEQQQQQQQQPIYDHTLPVPPHLSFNDGDYQSNLYFSSQTVPQPRQNQNIPFDTDEQPHQQRYRAYSEPASIQQDSITSNPPLQPAVSQIIEQQSQTQRATSIPMINRQTQAYLPAVRLIDNGRSYETEAVFQRRVPRIDPKTGLCLVPCPETQKYAHLPPHLRPELFCVELPPPSALPPVPPPPPPPPPPPVQQQHQHQHQQQQQGQRWCVRCCCVPGQTLVKKVVYRQQEEEQQHQHQEAEYDYASVIDQMATKISVRYGNSVMDEGEAFVSGNYNERLRVIDFPVYVSGKNDPNLTPLVPVN